MSADAQLLRDQNRVLERIARGAPLAEVLALLTTACETVVPDVLCSVLLLKDGCLHHGAAPSLDAAYCRAIDGMAIGPARGSCGTAAFTRQRVIVEDVLRHPYWERFHELATAAGLRACWSDPILSTRDEVLGTFAMYYRDPRAPGDEDLRVIRSFSHLAGIAIERARLDAELEQHRHHLEALVAERTAELQRAYTDVKVLRGMLPICAWCKSVRDDQGLWAQIEAYVAAHTDAVFTHGICPQCTTSMMGSRPT